MATNEPQLQQITAPPQNRIPDLKSIEEAAEFWDTHDSAEFEDKWEDVEVETRFVLVRPNERWFLLVLEEQFMTELEDRATRVRIDKLSLIQSWVLERVKEW